MLTLLPFCKCYSQPSHVVSYNYFSAQCFVSYRISNCLAFCNISFLCTYSSPFYASPFDTFRGIECSISLILKMTLESSHLPIWEAHFLGQVHSFICFPLIGLLANPISSFLFCLHLFFVEHVLRNYLKTSSQEVNILRSYVCENGFTLVYAEFII